jgi:hypothetical protein
VLSTRVGMGGLLLAKWIFIAFLGVLQLTVMFLWGKLRSASICSITSRASS